MQINEIWFDELRKRSLNDRRYLLALKFLESEKFVLFEDNLTLLIIRLEKKWNELYISKRKKPNPNRGFTKLMVFRNPNYKGIYNEFDKKLGEIIYDLKSWASYHDSILIKNKFLKVSPSKQKPMRPTDSNSVDTRIYEIIAFVSAWKYIEGNYSQNKLAEQLNINKGTLSKFFDRIIYKNGTKITAKQLLIKRVSEAVKIAEEKENNEKRARLNYFYGCLVNEAPTEDRVRGKQKKSYYNPHDKN